MKSYLLPFIILPVFWLSGCGKAPQPDTLVQVNGKAVSKSEAEASLKAMLSGDLPHQQQALGILQANPKLIGSFISELNQIAGKPIDYAYLEEIRVKSQSDPNYNPDDSDHKALELKQKMELRRKALELALSTNSKEALEIAERYAASNNPADANLAKEVLRNRSFQKSVDETKLPSASIGGHQYPANEYAEQVKMDLASSNSEQREMVLTSLERALAVNQKFPNLAPYIDYFTETASVSSSDKKISETRRRIAGIMAQSEDPRARPFLSNATNDIDSSVAESAAQALSVYDEWHKSETQSAN